MKLAALFVACLALVIAVATYLVRHSGETAASGQYADRCSLQYQAIVDRLGIAERHLRDGKTDDVPDLLHSTSDRMDAALAICFPATDAKGMDAVAVLIQRAREARTAADVGQVVQLFVEDWKRSKIGDGWSY